MTTNYQTPSLLKRKIKEYVRNFLSGRTAANDRVFISRAIPTQSEETPVILIYSLSESVDRFDSGPKSYRRNMTLLIECIERGHDDDDLDLRLEKMGEVVEDLMEQDETLGNCVNKIELAGSDYQVDPDAENPMGVLALRYNVEFFTFPYPDPTKLKRFDQANVDWKIGHNVESPDNVVDAENDIELEQ